MGYGLPAAIGASVAANGSKPVIAVMGDGSFQMDLPEMGTMAQWDIPVKMVLFQNHRLGMVHEHQYLLSILLILLFRKSSLIKSITGRFKRIYVYDKKI